MTAMTTVDGHLVIAAGNRVETHAWNGGRLQRTAFYDAQVMPSSRSRNDVQTPPFPSGRARTWSLLPAM